MRVEEINLQLVLGLIPFRNGGGNKSTFGETVIIGGSSRYIGAPQFAAEAAMLSGTGTSVIAVPSVLADALYSTVKFSALYPLSCKTSPDGTVSINFINSEIDKLVKRASAFAIGMGAASGDTDLITEYILNAGWQNLVIDADALKACKGFDFKNRAVLTPHIGEMSGLLNSNSRCVAENAEAVCREYALAHNAVVVLKNEITYISDGRKTFKNAIGNVKLAKGGSGDVLAGIIAGLMSWGMSNLDAAVCGCYILGRASELSEVNEYSHLPTDILKKIPSVFDEIISAKKVLAP